MIARFREDVETGLYRYRHLFCETGLIGQVLYLEAEAQGVRATGIGCFFDDPVHELMGLDVPTVQTGLPDDVFQSLYHFTVGGPREDARLATRAAYHNLDCEEECVQRPLPNPRPAFHICRRDQDRVRLWVNIC